MQHEQFFNQAISSWMSEEGPDSDIVLSSRIRLARNFEEHQYPMLFSQEEAKAIIINMESILNKSGFEKFGQMELMKIDEMQPLQKRVLVEKHLISPNLAESSPYGAVLLTENEEISIMVNEEDHIRIQCLYPGLQLEQALDAANEIDDWLENNIQYAFDEQHGIFNKLSDKRWYRSSRISHDAFTGVNLNPADKPDHSRYKPIRTCCQRNIW